MTDYRLHGVRLRVETEHREIATALDRRFSAYATSAGGDADLRLHYGGQLPEPPDDGRVVYEVPAGEVRYHPDEDALTAAVEDVRLHADLRAGDAWFAAPAWHGRARYLAAHTLTTVVLMERLERLGRYALHAGCVARDGRGVVLAGTAGAGKSTLTFALARRGLELLGDDTLFLRDGRAHGFRDAIGVTDATRGRFPELRSLPPRDDGFPKHLVRPESLFDTSDTCVPTMLVFPRIVATESRLEPMDPKEAWMRLVPDVLLTDPATTQRHLQALAALTEDATCWIVHSGQDADATARLLSQEL